MSVIRLLRLETLRLLRDPAGWLIAVMLVVSHAAAIELGARQYRNQLERHAEIRSSEEAAVTRLRQRAAELLTQEHGRRPQRSTFEAQWGPRNPGYANAWTQLSAIRHPAPLAVLAGGVSDLYPVSYKTSWRDVLTTPERLDPREAELVRAGWFDVSFVIVYVLPLAVLLLTATLVTEEREGGTWVLVRSTAAPLWQVVLVKIAPRVWLVLICLIVMCAHASVHTGVPALTAGFYSIATLYALVWFAAAAAVNTRVRSSTACASWCFGLWFALAVLMPAATDAIVHRVIPKTPDRDLTIALRVSRNAVRFDANEEQAAASLRAPDGQAARMRTEFVRRYPAYADENGLSPWGRYGVVQAAKEEALADLVAPLRQQIATGDQLRDAVISRAAWFCPPLLASRAFWRLANVDQRAQWDFLAQAQAYDRHWKDFFWPRMFVGTPFEAADYDLIPRFHNMLPAVAARAVTIRDAMALLAVQLLAVGLFLWRAKG